jgi:hypothetical protein
VLLLKIKDLRGGRSLVIFKHKAPLTWN